MSNLLNPLTPQEHQDPPLLIEAVEEVESPVDVDADVVVMELLAGEVEVVHEAEVVAPHPPT